MKENKRATVGADSAESWDFLRQLTHARIALGQAGDAVPTKELLDFRLAHSRARDSVWQDVDWALLRSGLEGHGLTRRLIEVNSSCRDKQEFLLNPDRGRQLADESINRLQQLPQSDEKCDCILVVADGLSASAVHANAAEFVAVFLESMTGVGLSIGSELVVARHARVALGDQIASIAKARSVVMLIGERPGLASAESLGVYFTWGAQPGKTDADRNCISNIHAQGLPPSVAAQMTAFLVKTSLQRQLSGVNLKVEYPSFHQLPR